MKPSDYKRLAMEVNDRIRAANEKLRVHAEEDGRVLLRRAKQVAQLQEDLKRQFEIVDSLKLDKEILLKKLESEEFWIKSLCGDVRRLETVAGKLGDYADYWHEKAEKWLTIADELKAELEQFTGRDGQ